MSLKRDSLNPFLNFNDEEKQQSYCINNSKNPFLNYSEVADNSDKFVNSSFVPSVSSINNVHSLFKYDDDKQIERSDVNDLSNHQNNLNLLEVRKNERKNLILNITDVLEATANSLVNQYDGIKTPICIRHFEPSADSTPNEFSNALSPSDSVHNINETKIMDNIQNNESTYSASFESQINQTELLNKQYLSNISLSNKVMNDVHSESIQEAKVHQSAFPLKSMGTSLFSTGIDLFGESLKRDTDIKNLLEVDIPSNCCEYPNLNSIHTKDLLNLDHWHTDTSKELELIFDSDQAVAEKEPLKSKYEENVHQLIQCNSDNIQAFEFGDADIIATWNIPCPSARNQNLKEVENQKFIEASVVEPLENNENVSVLFDDTQLDLEKSRNIPIAKLCEATTKVHEKLVDDHEELSKYISKETIVFSDSNVLSKDVSEDISKTHLFDDDTSEPLENFLPTSFNEGWEMYLRQPCKKKIAGQRFWKKVYIKFTHSGVIQIFNEIHSKEPFYDLPLQSSYIISDIGQQHFDQFGKIFTIKIQYAFYKERPGIRPGQFTKAERLTSKLSKFANYAWQGDYEGVKEFGSDLKKLGLPIQHSPQLNELIKLGTQNYHHLKELNYLMEEYLFHLNIHRDHSINYKAEEIQITCIDEMHCEINNENNIVRQLARVRIFLLAFVSEMPHIEIGINDICREGQEVVGRHDILPVATEEWIRLEEVEFHSCVDKTEFLNNRKIRFQPPDACYIELLRFRVRPSKNRELPLQMKACWNIQGKRVELNSTLLVPGVISQKLGIIPCEDVMICFPLPECWIYLFRVEKHFRYSSVRSAHRRTGKIKGMERILGAVEALEQSLMETSSGQAKYEHHYKGIVWRIPRLPKEGQGAYTSHTFACHLYLSTYDQMPENINTSCLVKFSMPWTTISHCTIRSLSINQENSPEKYVKYLSQFEYCIDINVEYGPSPVSDYLAAAYQSSKEQIQESSQENHLTTSSDNSC